MALAPYVEMCDGPEQYTLKLRFQINGTSDPDAQLPAGTVDAGGVTRSAAGVFDVQLPKGKRYPVFVGLVGSVMGNTGASPGLVVQSTPADYDASTGVLTVRTNDTYTDATPAPADPADNDWVYFEATFCRRSVLCSSGSV